MINKVLAKSKDSGEVKLLSKDDVRWTSGEFVGFNKGLTLENISMHMQDKVSVKDIYGNNLQVIDSDPRWVSGEFVGVNKGKSGLWDHINYNLIICEKCGKEQTAGNYKLYHGTNCGNGKTDAHIEAQRTALLVKSIERSNFDNKELLMKHIAELVSTFKTVKEITKSAGISAGRVYEFFPQVHTKEYKRVSLGIRRTLVKK